jgi:hypothetical protein
MNLFLIKFSGFLLLLAALSVVAVFVGYSNFDLGLGLMIDVIFEEIPVIKVTLFLVLVFFIDMFVAFYFAEGEYDHFVSVFYLLSCVTPFFTAFAILPGSLEASGYLGDSFEVMSVIVIAAQLLTAKMLGKDLWGFGKGKSPEQGVQTETSEFYDQVRDTYRILEHLSYVIEAVAADIFGEAKTEIDALILKVEQTDLEQKDFIVDRLLAAKSCLNDGQGSDAATYLSQISRPMWDKVTPRMRC